MDEANVKSGGKDYVIGLRAHDGRVGDVTVAQIKLPSQPFVDFGYGGKVDRETILIDVAQVRIEIEILGDHSRFSEFVHEDFARGDTRQVAIYAHARSGGGGAAAIGFTRVVNAAEQIEGGIRVADPVPTQTAAVNRAEVQALQFIVREIAADESE